MKAQTKSRYLENRTAVIIAGFRTPFMLSGRDFKDIREDELGASTVKELIERTSIKKEDIEELIVGNSLSVDGHLALSIARMAGLSESVSSWTVKKQDLSSLESLTLSVLKINQNLADIIIAGGVENISQQPFFFRSHKIKEVLQAQRWKEKAQLLLSFRPSDMEWLSGDPALFLNGSYGSEGQQVFAELPVSLEEQENLVSISFQKARQAQKAGKDREEIVPIFPPVDFEMKEKDGALSQALFTGALSNGTEPEELVRSGRQALWADGAVVFLIMSREKAKALGFSPLVSLNFFAQGHGEGRQNRALSPLYAVEKVLKKARLKARDIALWEIGESCPAQTLACLKGFSAFSQKDPHSPLAEVEPDKCNVNGGALSLGDPIGATPARMVLSLMREMKRQQVEWGLAAMGSYSQQAGALILKNE